MSRGDPSGWPSASIAFLYEAESSAVGATFDVDFGLFDEGLRSPRNFDMKYPAGCQQRRINPRANVTPATI